jgi:dephospho-CoA kinase
MTFVVGLTGGIGSGKSTVAKLFADKGITVIDTDQLARDVVEPNQPALQAIYQKLGPTILLPDGHLNRSLLRQMIFKNSSLRMWLENLLHPLIRDEIKHQTEISLSPYCIVVIPLLFETSPNPLIDRILTVDLPEEDQVKRTQIRDHLTDEEVKAILKSQVNRELRLEKSDDIIRNEGSVQELIPQVDNLHHLYLLLSRNSKNGI